MATVAAQPRDQRWSAAQLGPVEQVTGQADADRRGPDGAQAGCSRRRPGRGRRGGTIHGQAGGVGGAVIQHPVRPGGQCVRGLAE